MIQCPRCDEPTSVVRQQGAGKTLTLDHCPRCDGTFVDGVEVVALFPAFAKVSALLPVEAPRRAGIGACPRCQSASRVISFFEMELDVCPVCHGLWVDGDEMECLARSDDRLEGRVGPGPGVREKAAQAARQKTVTCAVCRAEVPFNRTMLTGDGTLCEACHANRMGENDDEELRSFEARLRQGDGSGWNATRDTLGAVGTVLFAVMGALGQCSRCRCHHFSHCHH